MTIYLKYTFHYNTKPRIKTLKFFIISIIRSDQSTGQFLLVNQTRPDRTRPYTKKRKTSIPRSYFWNFLYIKMLPMTMILAVGGKKWLS